MILSDVVAIALSTVGFLLSLQGTWLICRALWPNRVEAAATQCERNAVASFFLGLLITGIMLLIVRVAAARLGAPGKMIGLVVLFFYVMFAGLGMSGFVTHIGRRLPSPADENRAWRASIRGGIALELACLIPVLGWFGILPISLIIGCGAATMAVFSRSSATATFPEAPTLPSPELRRRPPGKFDGPTPALNPEGALP